MIVVTYTFSETEGIRQMKKSVSSMGYELAQVPSSDNPRKIMKDLYECYKRALTGHELMTYADAADTLFQRKIDVPTDYILYSTEKACFPHRGWAHRFKDDSRWKFLNNGAFCGPLKLVVEFFDRYKLHSIMENGQAAVQRAYLQAISEGFPVKLDSNCDQFQSIAFRADDEFEVVDGLVRNKITGTTPALLHGNGLSDMSWIYKLWN